MGIEPPQAFQFSSDLDLPAIDDGLPPYLRDPISLFANSHDFVISGGHFNIVHQEPSVHPKFRVIAAGDLVLKDVRLEHSSVVSFHQQQGAAVRRMYSAAVYGSPSTMTVAVYDGQNAKESWTEAISIYSRLRHPNVVQLFGTTSSAEYYTAIFHDDLVSAQKLLVERSESPLWTFYFQHFLRDGFRDAAAYISSALGGRWVSSEDCTIWIRASTGKICLELTPGHQVLFPRYSIARRAYQHEEFFDDSVKLGVADMITSTSFLQYYGAFCEDPPTTTLSELPASVSLGSILDFGPSRTGSGTVVASIPAQPAQGWRYKHRYSPAEDGEEVDWTWEELSGYSVVDDQWACINSKQVVQTYYYNGDLEPKDLHSWLAQANHIFNRSKISDNWERFAVVVRITITLTLEGSLAHVPPGFLFLYCPSPLHSTPAKAWNHSSVAYWSLDRTGQQRLSLEAAQFLGFPALKAEIGVHVKSWDSTTYLLIREFHEGKGFNAVSEDVARHLGLAPVSLYATPFEIAVQPPHIEETLSEKSENGDGHAEGSEEGEASEMLPRGLTMALSLQCVLLVAAASLAVFDHL
ncbi:hypothetical protein B0H19DRAFT_143309 [Mycena capillaripes]|nr:hypothetical protein B0H19DRAFT_143309 [Mycena capillaripes]